MFTLVLIIHVIVCFLLIFFVLLQSGRGADLGAAFGSMGQVGYARGKMSGIGMVTTGGAIVFMITSLTLAYMSSQKAVESVVQDLPPAAEETTPVSLENLKTQDSQTSDHSNPDDSTSASKSVSEKSDVPDGTDNPPNSDASSTIMEQKDAPPVTE